MAQKIKIIETPPGSAPEYIRKQWVGMEFTILAGMDDGSGLRTGIQNAGGYKVSTEVIREVIQKKGNKEFCNFWEPYLSASHFIVKKEVCKEL